MNNRPTPRKGMILLIVLGMLALFSLLAVTYVVFSSQSRTASVALANRDYRGTNSSTLMDQVVKQVVRGTQDTGSALWGHDLLGDLYGHQVDGNGQPVYDLTQVGNWPADGAISRHQQPIFVSNQFLRFPIRLPNDIAFGSPVVTEEDSLTGRLITFTGGPLAGRTFRIVKHVADDMRAPPYNLTPADPVPPNVDPEANGLPPLLRVIENYIYIDISEAENSLVQLPQIPPLPPRSVSLRQAAGNNIAIRSLFYNTNGSGYTFLINDPIRSGTGYGRSGIFAGNIDAVQQSGVNNSLLPTPVPLLNDLGDHSFRTINIGGTPTTVAVLPNGGTDESYDAADYNDYHLSYTHAGASASSDVIPSFHRPEIINYLANRVDWSSLTTAEVLRLVQLIDYSTVRPLSLNITNVTAADKDPNWNVPFSNNTILLNPAMAGNNVGYNPSMVPYLELNMNQGFASGSQNVINLQSFLRWLSYGPWDVDNDGDGIADSIWMDPNLPLLTSPEGKMLKPLVALQIEDLDGRLNVNAGGSLAQTNPSFYTPTNTAYAAGQNISLPQGFGYGPAEIGLRHLFPPPSPNVPDGDVLFASALSRRYQPRGLIVENPFVPGRSGIELASLFSARERRDRYVGGTLTPYRHGAMPSLRLGTHGEEAIGIDWNGQPLTLRGSSAVENVESPYESRLLSEASGDSHYTLDELERIIRPRDRDYSMLPHRLEDMLGGRGIGNNIRRGLTTRSVDVTNPELPSSDAGPQTPDNPFRQTIATLLQTRGVSIPEAIFTQLFPVEFLSGQKLNINRPLGDGLDNDDDGQIDEADEWFIVGANNGIDDDGDSNTDEGDELAQVEYYFNSSAGTAVATAIDNYLGGKPRAGLDLGMETRQILAREIYCLAQLIVPADYVFIGSPTANPSDTETAQYRARRLAQWAINLVDYRDADAAMTRFAYDSNPFEATGWSPESGNIVWGMEQPELLLRESIAFHDYAVKDTDVDDDKRTKLNDPNDPDDDPDQYLLPKGSLYLELYAPRTTSDVNDASVPGAPSSLYTVDGGGQVALNLAALAPSGGVFGAQPVWRVAISRMHQKDGVTPPNQVYYSGNRSRNDITYQLYSNAEAAGNGLYYNVADRSAQVPDIERIVWFTPLAVADPVNYTRIPGLPATAAPREHIYFNRSNATSLRGGYHMVIGPRADQHLGSQSPNLANNYQPSDQRIELLANEVRITGLDGNSTSSSEVKPIVGMVVAALPPAGIESDWADVLPEYGTRGGIGLSISEPLPKPFTAAPERRYYKIPTTQLNTTSGSGYEDDPKESWHDFAAPAAPYLPDQPFDSVADMLLPVMHSKGTYRDVSTAFLQRLADPQRPYDPALNPYITVDWISLDLTTFSGEDTLDGITDNPTPQQIDFTSRSRTGVDAWAGGTSQTESALYTYATTAPNDGNNGDSQVGGGNVYFDHQLVRPLILNGQNVRSSTFGFLNKEFGLPQPASAPTHFGHPQKTYAAQFWLNRQFANAMELMQVPASHPGQFGQEFTIFIGGTEPNPTDPLAKPFGHLMNFLSSTQYDFTQSPPAVVPGADFARLLAFLDTPSPWSDANRALDPRYIQNPTPPGVAGELVRMRAPFNFLSNFVTPGKVNLNTISSRTTWMGLESSYLPSTSRIDESNSRFWGGFEQIRRVGRFPGGIPVGVLEGQLPPGYTNHLNPKLPTQFAGVLKSPWQSEMAPRLSGYGISNQEAVVLRRNPIETTLFRSANPAGEPNRPWIYDGNNAQDPARYSYTAFQPLMRLNNLTTTHSNVFAVRMTMGYFEVDRASGHIGKEYNAEIGRNERNQGFFIIDRSVPVGYFPGVDLNSDNTVLVRRYFE